MPTIIPAITAALPTVHYLLSTTKEHHMKKTGKCPKCTSTQVIPLQNKPWYTKVYRSDYSLILRYACLDCGYVEEYLTDPDELAELRKKRGA